MTRCIPAIIVLSVVLAGCGSSGNPDGPLPDAPHQAAWVANHRGDIVSTKGAVSRDASGAPIVDSALISEHVFQCRVCHGANLTGAAGGAAGPACFDCHVLDPIKYPAMCYSCHGGYPMNSPQNWYAANRDKRPATPLSQSFINRVRSDATVHLKHAAIPGLSSIPVTPENLATPACSICHGDRTVVDWAGVHHSEVMPQLKLGCIGPLPGGCHTFGFSGGHFTFVTPECSACHTSPP